jgi:DNA-binding GntR family transcriptional regulator
MLEIGVPCHSRTGRGTLATDGVSWLLARGQRKRRCRSRRQSLTYTMAKPTAAENVFDQVVADILSGVLCPGDQISERDLVTRFGVSRTPVREAIKRLFERGLVEPGSKGVAVVMEIGREDLRKLYELRQQLERSAAKLTIANITPVEIEELRRVNKKFALALANRDLVGMLLVRAEFHGILVRATRNRWLAEMLIMLRDRAYVVRHMHWQDAGRAAQTLRIHNQMIDALKRRDAKAYGDFVVVQIRAAIECYDNQLRVPEPRLRRPAAGFEGRVLRAR